MIDSEQHVPLFSGVAQSSAQDGVSISRTELDTEGILATREIPWEIYSTARLVNDLELHLLRRYDNKKVGGSWEPGSPSTSSRSSSRLPSSSSLHRWRLLCGEVRAFVSDYVAGFRVGPGCVLIVLVSAFPSVFHVLSVLTCSGWCACAV